MMRILYTLKNFFQNNIKDFLKGTVLGAVMVVPGISGGTMAIVLGLYSKIIYSINDFFKFSKKNIIFLLVTGLGVFLGAVLFGNLIEQIMDKNPALVNYFFAGIVIGSLPLTIQQSQVTAKMIREKRKAPLYTFLFLIGAGFVIALSFLWNNLESISTTHDIFGLLINIAAGLITAVALVLPGISGSLFLKSIGLYGVVLSIISFKNSVDWFFLFSFGISTLIGIFLTSKAVGKIFEKYKTSAFIAISGFLLGTVITMLVDVYPRGIEWLFCPLVLVCGSAITISLYFIANSFSKRQDCQGNKKEELPINNIELDK